MLSGCRHHIISSMKTERHNVAGRTIIKALSEKGPQAQAYDTDPTQPLLTPRGDPSHRPCPWKPHRPPKLGSGGPEGAEI
eukprot:1058757-Pelagomonas_calceolata.AAC.1